jgi:hypothetical protein
VAMFTTNAHAHADEGMPPNPTNLNNHLALDWGRSCIVICDPAPSNVERDLWLGSWNGNILISRVGLNDF